MVRVIPQVEAEMEQVVGSPVLASITRIASVVKRVGLSGGHIMSRSISRLDDILWVREPIEDSGEFIANLREYSSRPLIARRIYRGKGRIEHVGVDSSSRYVETPVADMVVGSVAALSSLGSPRFEWPSLGGSVRLRSIHPIFYLLPNMGVSLDIEDSLASTVNPAGRPFDINYSVSEACDEIRVSLENWVLGFMEELSETLRNPVVMLDGPLYVVAKALTGNVPRWLGDVWFKLLDDRIKVVRRLESMGIPVLGVVKRVEKSTILSRTRGLEFYRDDVLVGDRSFVLKLMSLHNDGTPGRIYTTPMIHVRIPRVYEDGSLDKITQYIVIPAGRYQQMPQLARVYRIEFTENTLKLLEELSLEPHTVIGLDSVARGALEPLSIRLSDWRASSISDAFKRVLAMNIIGIGAPLSYWGLREVESTWRD